MKYFTIATLTLLAANAYASTASGPVTEDKPFLDKALSDIKEFFDEATIAVTNLIYKPPANVIKADLVEPKPISADSVVSIDPKENICVAANETEYWNNLYAKTDSKDIEKMVFCPNALSYLSNMEQVTLTGKASGDKLRDILVAFMLRKETLSGAYLDSYMVDGFLECFKQLKAKLHGDADPWPCAESTKCDAPSIQSNFSTFIDSTKECKNVLKDQLNAYAAKVVEASVTNNLKTSNSVRSAILTNLNATPHLSLSFRFLYDKAAEREKALAAARIEQVIADTCVILDKQFEGKSSVCADAKSTFTARLDAIKQKNTENSEVKKEDITVKKAESVEEKQNKSSASAASSSASSNNNNDKKSNDSVPEPTETDKAPTATKK